MPKAHLTQAFVANAGCEVGKKKSDFYDNTVIGFVLECRCTGGKTYYLRYVDQAGSQKQHKIGGYNDITFAADDKNFKLLRKSSAGACLVPEKHADALAAEGHPGLTVLRNEANLGFVGTVNGGLALLEPGEDCVLVNADTVLAPLAAATHWPLSAWAAAEGSNAWRMFEVTTKVELLKPSGVSKIWLPVPLLNDRDFHKTLGNTWSAPGGEVRYTAENKYGMGIVAAGLILATGVKLLSSLKKNPIGRWPAAVPGDRTLP